MWRWTPHLDQISLTGAARELGLGALVPEGSSAAPRALVLPSDRASIDEALRQREPGAVVTARVRTRTGETCVWTGHWLNDGQSAAGVAAPELRFVATDRDRLTGLLECRSFIALARERLEGKGVHELVVADLDRLALLNEALGHERADLVLATLGSRLIAAFPGEALIARIGEDEFAVLAPPSARDTAERMRKAMERPLRIVGFDHPTMSVGAARFGMAISSHSISRWCVRLWRGFWFRGPGPLATPAPWASAAR